MGFSEFKVEILRTDSETDKCCSAGPCQTQITKYVITVRSGGSDWDIQRRYSEFIALEAKLRDKFWYIDDLPVLPPKVVLFPKSDSSIEKRRLGLQTWLSKILQIGCFSQSSEMADFLEVLQNQAPAPALGKPSEKKAQISQPGLRHRHQAQHEVPNAALSDAQAAKRNWMNGGSAQAISNAVNSTTTDAETAKRNWMNGGAAKVISKTVNLQHSNQATPEPDTTPDAEAAKQNWMNGGAAQAISKAVTKNLIEQSLASSADAETAKRNWMNGAALKAISKAVAESNTPGTLSEIETEELKAIFDIIDNDSSGWIDRDELEMLGKAINPNFTRAKLNVLLARIDDNMDGKIVFEEFAKFFQADGVMTQDHQLTASARGKWLASLKKAGQAVATSKRHNSQTRAFQPDLKEPLRILFNVMDRENVGEIGSEEVDIFLRLTASSLPSVWQIKKEQPCFRIRQSEFIEAFKHVLTEPSLRQANRLAHHIFRVTYHVRMKLIQAFADCDQSQAGYISADVLPELSINVDMNKRDRTLALIQHKSGENVTLDVFLAYFGCHLGMLIDRPSHLDRELDQIYKQAALRSMR